MGRSGKRAVTLNGVFCCTPEPCTLSSCVRTLSFLSGHPPGPETPAAVSSPRVVPRPIIGKVLVARHDLPKGYKMVWTSNTDVQRSPAIKKSGCQNQRRACRARALQVYWGQRKTWKACRGESLAGNHTNSLVAEVTSLCAGSRPKRSLFCPQASAATTPSASAPVAASSTPSMRQAPPSSAPTAHPPPPPHRSPRPPPTPHPAPTEPAATPHHPPPPPPTPPRRYMSCPGPTERTNVQITSHCFGTTRHQGEVGRMIELKEAVPKGHQLVAWRARPSALPATRTPAVRARPPPVCVRRPFPLSPPPSHRRSAAVHRRRHGWDSTFLLQVRALLVRGEGHSEAGRRLLAVSGPQEEGSVDRGVRVVRVA